MNDYRAIVVDFSHVIPDFSHVILAIFPVIPAKAGIQKAANNLADRNQAPSATTPSP